MLPKGLHALRANLSPAPQNRVETLSPPATDAFGLPEGLLEMDDQPTLEDREVENIIMLAQGLPQLPPDGISLKARCPLCRRFSSHSAQRYRNINGLHDA